MNKSQANLIEPGTGPASPVPVSGADAGKIPVQQLSRFSGIRSSGQSCSPNLTRIGPAMTASAFIRQRSAAHGMCPLMTIS